MGTLLGQLDGLGIEAGMAVAAAVRGIAEREDEVVLEVAFTRLADCAASAFGAEEGSGSGRCGGR